MMSNVLKKIQQEDFKDRIFKEFQPRSFTETGAQKVQALSFWSYAPNAISVLSASFFVWYLISNYSLAIQLALGAILSLVVVANEIAKRKLLSSVSKQYYSDNKLSAAVVFIIACIGVSVYTSYQGGNQVVIKNSLAPTLEINPEITRIKGQLSSLADDINKQKSTTWKGRITVDANRNLKQLYSTQANLATRLIELEAAQGQKQAASDSKHNTQIINAGMTLGVICILADIVLIFLLVTIQKIKYQAYRVELQKSKTGRKAGFVLNAPTQQPFSENMAASRTIIRGFHESDDKEGVFNVLNGPDKDMELKALITGHQTRASSYSKRKTPSSKKTANYHASRVEELKKLEKVS